MNIILVMFDSLRRDCVNAYGPAPWWPLQTPHFDAFAEESVIMTRAYPESLPTLPARRALYTGRRCYPFHNGDFRLKGDFVGAAGWGPIPEDQPTLAELLRKAGYRTGLVSDLYHMFKPSKNFWRGFDEWKFLRGQEIDTYRSGPRLSQEEVDRWLPKELQEDRRVRFLQRCIMNIHDRGKEEDFFPPRVFSEAALWLEQNQDADRVFLTVESFDPHEPWLVPPHYRKMYMPEEGREQVLSWYDNVPDSAAELVQRTQANYCGSVSLCDRWFGYFMESMRVLGLLDNSLVIFASDHGHSIGDRAYMGKRGYPSAPEVYETALMLRFPKGEYAGTSCDAFVQHTDIAASILDAADVEAPAEIEGSSFLKYALTGGTGPRDHVTVGWGSTPTVINDRWWFNCKVDGTGVLLHDLSAEEPFAQNVAQDNPEVVSELFRTAEQDATDGFPEWLLELARNQADAPGCSDLAARE